MKKLILVAVFAVSCISSMNSQGHLKVGIGGGIPVGDISDFFSFTMLADVGYLWDVSDVFEVGAVTGYIHSFGDKIGDISIDDEQFVTAAAGVNYYLNGHGNGIHLDLNIGYGIGINEGNDGGFYYRPGVGYNVSENASIDASFSGISANGGTASNVLLRFQWQLAL